jgi:hypothetical protein
MEGTARPGSGKKVTVGLYPANAGKSFIMASVAEGEGASVGGRCGAGGSGEVAAEVWGGTEAAGVRHILDRKVGLFE